jgi:hypothetical protein
VQIEKFFFSYKSIRDDDKVVYLGDSKIAKVLGKSKILLKLTSGKILTLNDILHVPTIRANLVSLALFGKAGVKVSFEFSKIVMTKNYTFVRKGYCNQGLLYLMLPIGCMKMLLLLLTSLTRLIYGMLD